MLALHPRASSRGRPSAAAAAALVLELALALAMTGNTRHGVPHPLYKT
jgi:hypothetical protein